MKILLLAKGRTGSKFTHAALQQYIVTAYTEHAAVFDEGKYGMGMWDPRLDKTLYASDDHRSLLLEHIPVANELALIANRAAEYAKIDTPLVSKYHYDNSNRAIIKLLKSFDHTIVLRRRDLFSQLLSSVISIYLNNWSVNPDDLVEPITIPVLNFKYAINRILVGAEMERALVRKVDASVYFEDVVACTNSIEFCKLLKLKPFEFDLPTGYAELGVKKFDLITNIDELESMFVTAFPEIPIIKQ